MLCGVSLSENVIFVFSNIYNRSMNPLLERITLNPNVCKGRPTIRNMRFTVTELLELLAAGMTVEEILIDYPYLQKEDIHACLVYASLISNTKNVISFPATT